MIADHYTTTFQTYRLSGSVDANNFEIETEVLNLTDKGFFEPLTGAQITVNDKTEERTTHRLFTEILDISGSDEIRVASIPYNIDLIQDFNGDHLEITLIRRT